MQYLVTTCDNGDIKWDNFSEILESEAENVLSLFSRGILRNIWFTDRKDAVLLFECGSIEDVSIAMNQLPLVLKSLIKYEIVSLYPYTGFERVIHGTDKCD